MHKPTPSVIGEDGTETHPAFGIVSVNRVHASPGEVLFDSDIRHNRYIRLRVNTAERKRDLKHDRIHGVRADLVEIDLSEAQWAALVSSIDTSGVPCTLRKIGDQRDIPGLLHEPRLAVSMQETHNAAEEAFAKIQAAMQAVDELDPKAGAKARRDAMQDLRSAIANSTGNVDFAAKSLVEHAENVVTKARSDIEAMVSAKAEQLGIDASQVGGIAAIESGADHDSGDRPQIES